MEVIESLEQLEQYAKSHRNMRLLGLINRFKFHEDLDERIIALASIIQTLRRKGIKYDDHFVRHCLLYFCT